MVRECKNLPNCGRGESCWYKHPKEVVTEASETSEPVSTQTPTTSESQKFKCRICDNDFSGKSALMKHRKTDHIDRVRQCTDFASNYCRRGDLQCWYKHSLNSQSVQSPVDFCPAQQSLKPPDQMEMMRSMMMSMQQMWNKSMNEMMSQWTR